MLNLLKKTGNNDRLIHILQAFFTEKARSTNPGDRENLIKLVADIQTADQEHSGIAFRIILMQRLIMYGVNESRIVSYYYDIITTLSMSHKLGERRRIALYLLKKTQVSEYHCFYPLQPTLKEAIQTQLQAWIEHMDKTDYQPDNFDKENHHPPIQLLRSPANFMQIFRLMTQARIIRRTDNLNRVCSFFSRIVISKDEKRYTSKTLENAYEYRNPKDLQTTIHLLERMKEIAEEELDEILRRKG